MTPLAVAVSLHRDGKKELSTLSTLEETEAVRDEVMRRQQVAENA